MPIIECIPNFSEGSNIETLNEIAKTIQSVKGVKLLHQDSGVAANRTVFTYAGEVDAATYKAIQVATKSIDMQIQKGEHPRIGACDVCPFVPISGIKMNELVDKVSAFGEKVSNELDIPIFLYEESAKSENRKNLAKHRVGGYEELQNRITTKNWLPNFGKFNATTGGTVMGARNYLVAYNINLNTKDAKIAQEIAYDLRELGRPIGKESGRTIYRPGKLQKVKAIGWYIEDFSITQVSINLTDYQTTSLYETGKRYAKNKGLQEQEYIQLAVNKLGLSNLLPFEPNLRILEYVMNA